MDLQQLVKASEILENLEKIEDQISHHNKKLSENGIQRIDEIIKECCDALSVGCKCGDKGRKEFERINALILELSLRIKSQALSKTRMSELLV